MIRFRMGGWKADVRPIPSIPEPEQFYPSTPLVEYKVVPNKVVEKWIEGRIKKGKKKTKVAAPVKTRRGRETRHKEE